MKSLKVLWTGIRPLVMHNGLLADPLNPLVIAMKKITAKKNKKTDTDLEELARLEWMGGIYRGAEGQLVIPSDNIERCIQLGAMKSRLGKDAQAAVLMTEAEANVEHADLSGRSIESLYEDKTGRFILRKGVKVTTNRVIRIRPLIPTGWKVRFEVEFDDSIINERALTQAMVDAGSLIGLGDWRPKFGRFSVEVLS